MSQHSYPARTSDGQAVNVLMGWDRPCQCYFLIVQLQEWQEGQPSCLYSYLEEKAAFDLSLDYYVERLDRFGITAPVEVLEQVWLDAILNTGNRVVAYREDGTLLA